ncbi:metal-dependent hydrolase [Nitrincola tibetensis]|uniref:Metal-dependent hydrolase n=1 Tax=Nitrincola tibetensis TaxID=2219697 RepID=A0A364NSI7_9GAMM|nr:metal-dependent hydrolase [Nitrincola tibetensis]RAU19837.1 metal-dependent hydrolase [Nitrincola tibetensis]
MSIESPIFIRNIHFPIQDVKQHDWFEGDPLRTSYCDALSVLFPAGERFFIKSVKHYLDKIEDPDFREEVRRFCIQEAFHTREHEAYNAQLASYGYDVEKMEARVIKALGRVKSPIVQLAFTVAIEHLTATLSYLILKDPKVLAKVTPVYRDLWTWHALEEMEHKAVAFDVYQLVTRNLSPWKRYMLRVGALFAVTIDIHRMLLINFNEMLTHRGESKGPKMWLKSAWSLFGNPGYYRRVIFHYLRFYSPFFHPWKGDDGKLMRQGRQELNNMMNVEPKHVD